MFLKMSIEYTSTAEALLASLAKISFKGGQYFGAHLEGIARLLNYLNLKIYLTLEGKHVSKNLIGIRQGFAAPQQLLLLLLLMVFLL